MTSKIDWIKCLIEYQCHVEWLKIIDLQHKHMRKYFRNYNEHLERRSKCPDRLEKLASRHLNP